MKSLLFKSILLASLCGISGAVASSEYPNPYLYVLGVVQDAGYPQAGCYKVHCMPGWEDVRLRRGTVSLGLIDSQSSVSERPDSSKIGKSKGYAFSSAPQR